MGLGSRTVLLRDWHFLGAGNIEVIQRRAPIPQAGIRELAGPRAPSHCSTGSRPRGWEQHGWVWPRPPRSHFIGRKEGWCKRASEKKVRILGYGLTYLFAKTIFLNFKVVCKIPLADSFKRLKGNKVKGFSPDNPELRSWLDWITGLSNSDP